MISYSVYLFLSDSFHLAHCFSSPSLLLQMAKFHSFYDSVVFPYIYIPYFLYPSIYFGHSGYFHILAIVNSAAVNIEVHVSFSVSVFVFSDIHPAVELLGHMVVPVLVFERTSIFFSTVVAPIYIPTNSVQGFLFLHILSKICYL